MSLLVKVAWVLTLISGRGAGESGRGAGEFARRTTTAVVSNDGDISFPSDEKAWPVESVSRSSLTSTHQHDPECNWEGTGCLLNQQGTKVGNPDCYSAGQETPLKTCQELCEKIDACNSIALHQIDGGCCLWKRPEEYVGKICSDDKVWKTWLKTKCPAPTAAPTAAPTPAPTAAPTTTATTTTTTTTATTTTTTTTATTTTTTTTASCTVFVFYQTGGTKCQGTNVDENEGTNYCKCMGTSDLNFTFSSKDMSTKEGKNVGKKKCLKAWVGATSYFGTVGSIKRTGDCNGVQAHGNNTNPWVGEKDEDCKKIGAEIFDINVWVPTKQEEDYNYENPYNKTFCGL